MTKVHIPDADEIAALIDDALGDKKPEQPIRDVLRPRTPKLSQEEQESRRAIKRFKRQKRSERLSARQRGLAVTRQRQKAATKKRKRKERDGA